MKVQPQLQWRPFDIGNTRTVGWYQGWWMMWSGPGWRLLDKLYLLQMSDPEKWGCLSSLESTRPWVTPNITYWSTSTVGFWFWFDFVVTVPWFFSLGIKENIIYFGFYRSLQLRDFGYFKETLKFFKGWNFCRLRTFKSWTMFHVVIVILTKILRDKQERKGYSLTVMCLCVRLKEVSCAG